MATKTTITWEEFLAAGELGDRLGAVGALKEAERTGRQVVVGVLEGDATGVGDDDDLILAKTVSACLVSPNSAWQMVT